MAHAQKTIRLTVAQALVKYIAAQYSVADGVRERFIPAAFGIFGHGNVAGLGQALDEFNDELPFIQGRNEQALAHAAIAFAKAKRRRQALAVTASIGPGALNMVTAAGLATVNRLPVLLLPGDTYATRRQGPVLQQIEDPSAPDITANDAFRPVSRFFDRITRPEQLLTALPQAFRVLANPVETGAVVIALPQDIQSHAHDYPVEFFEPHDWKIRRPQPEAEDVRTVAEILRSAKKPLIIAGGGVVYSGATAELEALANATGIPVAETFGGKGAIQNPGPWHVWGIGLEGSPETNRLVEQADVILHVGTRLTDFATASQSLFHNPNVRFVSLNVSEFDGVKQGAATIVADAKVGLAALTAEVSGYRVPAEWTAEIAERQSRWVAMRAAAIDPDVLFPKTAEHDPDGTDAIITQGQMLGVMQEHARDGDILIAGAGGSSRRRPEGVGCDERAICPSRIRILVHGLRTTCRHRSSIRRARPSSPRHDVYRRRNVPHGSNRTRHGGSRRPPADNRYLREPRLSGHPTTPDVARWTPLRQRVPISRPGEERGQPGRIKQQRGTPRGRIPRRRPCGGRPRTRSARTSGSDRRRVPHCPQRHA